MGLEGFFSGLPQDFDSYAKYASEAPLERKLERVVGWNPLDSRGVGILNALKASGSECEAWMEGRRCADRSQFTPFALKHPLWRLQQLAGQVWAGVPYQICWLPAQRAAGDVTFISPYLDAEIVRFGISLPLDLKFKDGVKKFLLHRLLERQTGIRVGKRASPNPARMWTLFPDASLPFRMDRRLIGPYAKQFARNIVSRGGLHSAVASTAALGVWLRTHRLGEVEG